MPKRFGCAICRQSSTGGDCDGQCAQVPEGPEIIDLLFIDEGRRRVQTSQSILRRGFIVNLVTYPYAGAAKAQRLRRRLLYFLYLLGLL